MGLSFRKTLRLGPINVSLSTSGIQLSAGLRGARVSVGPRGTYVSFAAGAFHYRKKLDNAPNQGPMQPPRGSYGANGFIATASVTSLQQTSPDEFAHEIERNSARIDWFKPYWISALVVVFLALVSSNGWVALVLAALLAGLGFHVRRWNDERRSARLLYDVDDPVAMERFAIASAAGEALAQSAAVWHVYHAIPSWDPRRNAGATTLIRRTLTQCVRGTFSRVETNLEPWSIPAGPQQLLLLPDRLLLLENGRVAALPYEYLSATAVETKFVEEGPTPRDGEVVATTWRFVCKDGTPDLRFNDNHQLPVLRYGELTIASQHGIRIVFHVSRAEAALRVAYALNTLSAVARNAIQVYPTPAPPSAAPGSGRARRVAATLVDAPGPINQSAPPAPSYVPPISAPPSYQPPTASQVPATYQPSASSTVPAKAEPERSLAARPPEPPGIAAMQPAVQPVHPTPSPSRPPERPAASPSLWVPPGSSTIVAGYELPGGMIYVGEHLRPVSEFRNTEPALINPRLLVDRARINRTGEGMTYWPSYSEISPSSRAGYLEWLAGGRSTPDAYIGYVFLFLYGLERRVLADAQRSGITVAERESISSEIQRLIHIYGGNSSFGAYATELLGAVWIRTNERVYERCEPPTTPIGSQYPLLLRIGLGQLARDGRPLPADWALAWVLCDPEIRLTTPAKRCPGELRQLFRIRYAQAFGQGMMRKPVSKNLVIRYRPASASFGGEVVLSADGIPDVTARTSSVDKLHALVEQCAGELDAFSRWIGRNPDQRGSISAAALLPVELLATHQGEESAALCRVLEASLDGQETALTKAAELFRGKPSKADVTTIVQLLQKKGYGVEPDIRFGGELPRAEGKVVVFRIPEGSPVAASAHYRSIALLLHLAVAVAAADGAVSEAEEQRIEAQLQSLTELSIAERTRLAAHVRWLAHERPGLSKVKKRISALSVEQRGAVADFIVAMAAADGRIDPGEVKMLAKLFPMLGLDTSEVYRRIHALAGAKASPATEPVAMQSAKSAQGYKILPQASTEGIVLDMASVQSKLAETSAVAALLDSIFAEEDPAPSSAAPDEEPARPAGPAPAPPSGPLIGNLNAAHSAFVCKLREQPSWSRGEVEVIAAGLGLLTDGALETVNEAAFEVCGSPVWSGDDPIEIDVDVMKELCP